MKIHKQNILIISCKGVYVLAFSYGGGCFSVYTFGVEY